MKRVTKYYKLNNINIIPDMTLIVYNKPKIIKFSFKFLLYLNSTNKAIPLLTKSPEINEPNDIALFKNSSVIITLEAQLGISPNKLITNGPKILSFKNIVETRLLSKVSITNEIAKLTKNINTNIWKVCFKEETKTPSSQ